MSDRFNMFGETKDHVIQRQAARIEALEKEVASFQQALKSCHGLSDELDEANDRIEALEAALENEAIVSRDAFARIEALEAALREANRPVRWRRPAIGWRR